MADIDLENLRYEHLQAPSSEDRNHHDLFGFGKPQFPDTSHRENQDREVHDDVEHAACYEPSIRTTAVAATSPLAAPEKSAHSTTQ